MDASYGPKSATMMIGATTGFPESQTNVTETCQDNPEYIPTVMEFIDGLQAYGVVFLTIGAITTVVLYGLFIQQMWFTFSYTHKAYRRHVYWLISIYPFMALMSTLTLIVPRSYNICNAVKITYMSVGVGHFADLTIMMYGSENKMIYDLRDSHMRLNLLPFCCCCKCLPQPPVTKVRMSVVKWMIWQMKWTQGLYFLFMYILRTGMETSDGLVPSKSSFIWLTLLNFASFLSGVWALNIMDSLSSEQLAKFSYKRKCLAVKILILTTKLQNFLFTVLGNNGVYPCVSTKITPMAFQIALENSIYLAEMFVFGIFSYVMYSRHEFVEYNNPVTYPEFSRQSTNKISTVSEGGVHMNTNDMNLTAHDSSGNGSMVSSSDDCKESAYGTENNSVNIPISSKEIMV